MRVNILDEKEVPELSESELELLRLFAGVETNPDDDEGVARGIKWATLKKFVSRGLIASGTGVPTADMVETGVTQIYYRSGSIQGLYISIRGGAWQNIALASNSQTNSTTVWLTSDDFTDGDLTDSDTLTWSVENGAPTGVADGSNTQCTIPKIRPDNSTSGIWLQLLDGDDSDSVKDEQLIPWLHTSPDIKWALYGDSDAVVFVKLELLNNVPTFTVTTEQDSSNTLTGMFLKVSANS